MQAAMRVFLLTALLAGAAASAGRSAAESNPLAKTLELIDQLVAKIIGEGEAELKAYKEYVEWCDDQNDEGQFNVDQLKKKIARRQAVLDKAKPCIEVKQEEVEDLIGKIKEAEEELKNATLVRNKEKEDFAAAEAELMAAVDILERAIAILEREFNKNPALMQVDASNLATLVRSLGVVIDAAAFPSSDKSKLLALVQSQQSVDEGEDAAEEAKEAELAAPDPAAYKSHSKPVMEILESMLEKAKADLAALRKAEQAAQHNFNMLKPTLEKDINGLKGDMPEPKDEKNECEIEKAEAEDELARLRKLLAEAEAAQHTAQLTCMQVAADHEATLKSRAEELKALHEAKKILQSTTSGAESQTYSFVQVASGSKLKSRTDLANMEVVSLIKRIAKQHHSRALAQLASKISVVMQFGATGGDDPFAKIKGLINEMIDRLVKEAADEAAEKGYCDEQMSKTEAKKSDLEDTIAKLTSKLDKHSSKSATLKEEVKELQARLAALTKEQAEMDKVRQEQNAAYLTAKADLEAGLNGVRKALEVLNTYYGGAFLQDGSGSQVQQPPLPEKHGKSSGAGGGIIDILQVVEADFADALAKTETEEADAAADYEKTTQENKIERTMMEQDVKYKTQEYTGLDKEIAELSNDKDTESTELSAVLEYYEQIKGRCIAKPETFESRAKRREAEISGLKQALSILEGEALFQRAAHGRAFRR